MDKISTWPFARVGQEEYLTAATSSDKSATLRAHLTVIGVGVLSIMSSAIITSLREHLGDSKARSWLKPHSLREMIYRNWYLGLTSFGGPAVHFQIV